MSDGDDDLVAALDESRRLGMLGDRPIPEVIEHAEAFVAAVADVDGRVVDLGSGGGVPGLVVAVRRPDLEVVLVDRRTKRTDLLERLVGRLGLKDRVRVRAVDAEGLARTEPYTFDAAIARGFGPPMWTLGIGASLVCVGGLVVISEPPSGDRWPVDEVAALDVERLSVAAAEPGVAIFRRLAER